MLGMLIIGAIFTFFAAVIGGFGVYSAKWDSWGLAIPAWILAIAVFATGIVYGHYMFGTQRTATFTVLSLDDQASNKGHTYLVFAKSGMVYEDVDTWLHGKTDSSNVWAAFLAAGPGSTWTCQVYGERFTPLSLYPNILDGCKRVSKGG